MKLVVCLDLNNGMLFNHRRQSRDRQVCQDILASVGGGRLCMNAYSARLFPGAEICVDEQFWLRAGDGDTCFAETEELSACLEAAEQITVYRWDRVYPADVYFPGEQLDTRTQTEVSCFPGSSHQEIAKEVYLP